MDSFPPFKSARIIGIKSARPAYHKLSKIKEDYTMDACKTCGKETEHIDFSGQCDNCAYEAELAYLEMRGGEE